MKSIEIDRSKRLKEEPDKGHNRWHPDIAPVLEVDPGEEVVLETRDAMDCQIRPDMTAKDLRSLEGKVAHALTGPVYVKGAMPGDLLEIEYLDLLPQPYGWTTFRPGAGFLRDSFPDPYWSTGQYGTGGQPHPKSLGLHPQWLFHGHGGSCPVPRQMSQWTAREAELVSRGGIAFPQTGRCPAVVDPIAREGLRTIPPRENCGNVDAKQLTKGSRLMIPVNVDGALFSVGAAHFAQGDGECCITAIEMSATAAVPSRCTRVWPPSTTSGGPGSPILAISPPPSGRRPGTLSPPWACLSGRRRVQRWREPNSGGAQRSE